GAVEAVFSSWNSRRAKRYRKANGIPDSLGTAVTIQAMVFGNVDEHSGTGVLFSRNPITGEREPYGEYMACAQGEDVVAGSVTPEPIAILAKSNPRVYKSLLSSAETLEAKNKEVQDIEFTIERGKLFLLQTRNAKRAPLAALHFAVDFVKEGVLEKLDALSRISVEQLRSLTAPVVASSALRDAEILLTGEGACPGVGQGTLVASSGAAEDRNAKGEDVVLGSAITSPEDIHGMIISKALVTESGGSTSHAAVVGRSLGIPTVVKCGEGKVVELQDEEVTVDGSNGIVYRGLLPLNYPETESNYLAELSSWLDELCPLDVFSLSDSIPNEVLDLDVVDGGNDAEMLPALLQEATYARGSILDSTAGIAAAVRSSIKGIVVPHPLSARLAAIKVNLMK
ncbi:MAG TPA: pyruvate, phosphate dikinase, partial [Gammaproteobacteria bacterium]|nr:pyruvate, phosphate dikinase [Gammaproteobacteria bacterium]